MFEGQFKRIMNRGEVPTIVDPDRYKYRFKRAMKRYFIGMIIQDEKIAKSNREHVEGGGHDQSQIMEDRGSDEEEEPIQGNIKLIQSENNTTPKNDHEGA